jgi:hypothetical protein
MDLHLGCRAKAVLEELKGNEDVLRISRPNATMHVTVGEVCEMLHAYFDKGRRVFGVNFFMEQQEAA